MKRTILAAVLIIYAFFGISQNAHSQAASPIDLILLLDTSQDMSSSYDNVNNYITGAFLNEFLRIGDTFHLITFSNNTRLDAARRIAGVGDVETIIGRMMLQYPLERGSNPGAALTYTEQYLVSLPQRPKKVVLVSPASTQTADLVNAARGRLSSRNTTLDFVQVTPGQALANLPASGRAAPVRTATTTQTATTQPARDTQTGTQQQATQPSRETQTGTQQQGVSQQPSRDTQAGTQQQTTQPSRDFQTGTQQQGGTQQQITQPARDTQTGTQQQGGTQPFRDTQTEQPFESDADAVSQRPIDDPEVQSQEPQADRTTDNRGVSAASSTNERRQNQLSGFDWSESMPLIIGLIIAALLIIGLVLLLSSRRLGSSPNRVMAEVAGSGSGTMENAKFVDHSKDLAKYKAQSGSVRRSSPYENRHIGTPAPVINPTGPLLLNLFVDDQNTAIGKRNIHSLKSGYSLSVGGGKSDDFLIFLVPIPGHIGEIHRNGSSLTFVPRKPKYFPDLASGEVRDCINKTIRVVSDKNYEMRFRFEMYEDPLIALNRVLMSVKVPG